MRIKVQQDTSILVRKPSRATSTTRSLKRVFRRKRYGVHHKIKFAPVLGDAFEHGLYLARCAHVERHHDLSFQCLGERLDVFLRLFVGKRGAVVLFFRSRSVPACSDLFI